MNDRLDDLFNDATAAIRTPDRAPEGYRPAEQVFVEGCPKRCRNGKFVSWSGRIIGDCFACKGRGTVTRKTAPEVRQRQAEARVERKVRLGAEALEDFTQQYPAEGAWLKQRASVSTFANSMLDAICRFGDLTDGKMAAIRRCMQQDADRAAQRAERVTNAPAADTAGIDRLKAAFDKAIAFTAEKGLKLSPRITIGGVTIRPAKATSANPGALYVKSGSEYLGKIADGKFFASRECSEEMKGKVLAFVADPAEAAKVYGQTTGTCCVCNATLISKWKERGIGPICAQKFGW